MHINFQKIWSQLTSKSDVPKILKIFKNALICPFLTKFAKITGKMAFLANFKQTLLKEIGVKYAGFGNCRGQKHDLAKIDFFTHEPLI